MTRETIELVAEIVQLERQLDLLIRTVETYLGIGPDEPLEVRELYRQYLMDRIETAKAHLN